jgi:hypothetical protein
LLFVNTTVFLGRLFHFSGDVNAVFMLLNWGANPDTRDHDDVTPLMWIVKNREGSQDLIRLLLRFGANTLLTHRESGNSVLHELAQKVDGVLNLSTAFLIYQASPVGTARNLKNADGLTAYSVRRSFTFCFFPSCCCLFTSMVVALHLFYLLFLFQIRCSWQWQWTIESLHDSCMTA